MCPNAAGQPTVADVTLYSGLARQQLVQRFERTSFLLQQVPFVPAVTPNIQEGILAYTYTRTATQRGASFRPWYEDYIPAVATTDQVTTQLRALGGAIEIDRVFADADRLRNNDPGIASYLDYQTNELSVAGAQMFHNAFINGNTTVDPNSYDGLSRILDGTTSEKDGASLNLAVPGADNGNFWALVEALEGLVFKVSALGLLPIIMTNTDGTAKLSMIAARLNYRASAAAEFGARVTTFAGAPIVNVGVRPGTLGVEVIPTTSGGATAAENGLTDIYVVGLGISGVHAIGLTGDSSLRIYTDLFDGRPGVTKRLEVELVTALVVKQADAAHVLRDVRVRPQAA